MRLGELLGDAIGINSKPRDDLAAPVEDRRLALRCQMGRLGCLHVRDCFRHQIASLAILVDSAAQRVEQIEASSSGSLNLKRMGRNPLLRDAGSRQLLRSGGKSYLLSSSFLERRTDLGQ
ncbi:hypothetical protein D3C86_1492260 [compost metagenome]